MSLDRVQLGQNLRRLRKEAGLTQEQLAERLGCSNAAISQFERGTTMPGVAAFVELADAVGATFGVLLGEPLACAEHAVAQVRKQVRALGYDLALIPREDTP